MPNLIGLNIGLDVMFLILMKNYNTLREKNHKKSKILFALFLGTILYLIHSIYIREALKKEKSQKVEQAGSELCQAQHSLS